jgi:hypothetical protein
VPSDGGSPITSYTVTPFISGSTALAPVTVTGSPPATSTTVGGLTNGTSYIFTVVATNTIGTSPASAASSVVIPGPPTAPTGVLATGGNGSATVSWTAPVTDGHSPITSYTVTPFVGSTAQTPVMVTGSPPATSTTLTGLTNGITYTFTVSATNAGGAGPPSAPSNAVTPNPLGNPNNTQGTAIPLGQLACGQTLQQSGTTANDGSQAWYQVAIPGVSPFLNTCTLHISLAPGDNSQIVFNVYKNGGQVAGNTTSYSAPYPTNPTTGGTITDMYTIEVVSQNGDPPVPTAFHLILQSA